MIHIIDKNAKNCGRTFYEAITFYDHRYVNQVITPVDYSFVNYTEDNLFFIVSGQGFYNDNEPDLINEVIEQVEKDNVKILFDFSFEGDWRGISRFIKSMESAGVPSSKYKILTGSDKVQGNFPECICHVPMFELKARYSIQENLRHNFGTSQKKKYALLNSRPRPHRILLTCLLEEKGLLDKGYCSLPAENNQIENYDLNDTLQTLANEGFLFSDNTVACVRSKLPLVVDDINPYDSLALNDSIFGDIYDHVDFVLITESMVKTGDNMVFVTEKILKAIANRKPFIVLGDKYTLKYLRQIGYKTFDFLVDESYDELDYVERTYKIVEEVQRLCYTDFSKYRNEIEQVTSHNFDTLMNKSRYDNTVRKIINFLEDSND